MLSPQRDLRDTLREMIAHENELRDQRLGYLLTLNGFLFAALSLAWTAPRAKGLVIVVSVLGTMVALGGIAGMKVSDLAIAKLRSKTTNPLDDPPIVGMTGDLPVAKGGLPPWVKTFVPWESIPKVLLLVWPVVLIVRVA